MEILRKVYEEGKPKYHVKTDLGLLIKVTVSDDMTREEIHELISLVAQDMDKKLQDNIE
jgi:cell division GTPase FtsZ